MSNEPITITDSHTVSEFHRGNQTRLDAKGIKVYRLDDAKGN